MGLSKISDYKFFITSSLIGIFAYIGLVIVAVIVAGTLGPEGYGIHTHYMSDLGDGRISPAPWIYDLSAILAGALSIPSSFYMRKVLVTNPLSLEESNRAKLRSRLGIFALIFSLLGNFGYIGVGIWSADPSRENMFTPGLEPTMHMVMSIIVFGGFEFGAFFYGWIIVKFNDTKVPKAIGIYGVLGPIVGLTLFLIFKQAFFEWLMMFLILAWLVPLCIVVLRNEELQLRSK